MTPANAAPAGAKLHASPVAAGQPAKQRATGGAAAAAAATSAASDGAADGFANLLEGMRADDSAAPGAVVAADHHAGAIPGAATAPQSTQADRSRKPATVSPLALLAHAALVPPAALPALPATAVDPGPCSAARVPNANAAADAVSAAPDDSAGATPVGSGARRTATLRGADLSPGAGDATAPVPHSNGVAASAAAPAPAAAESSRDAALPAGPAHGLTLPSALALPTPGQPAPAAPVQAPAVAAHQAALPSRPLDAAFPGDLAAEVSLMVQGGTQRAELRLDPADLGPIHIELTLNAQTADISFAAAHSLTRDGITQALPELRDMLAGQGLNLGHAGVSSGQQGQAFADAQRQARAMTHAAPGTVGAIDAAATGTAVGVMALKAARGVLDLYA